MQTAVIYAHPNPNSFNGAILNQVIKALEDGKHFMTSLICIETGLIPFYYLMKRKGAQI